VELVQDVAPGRLGNPGKIGFAGLGHFRLTKPVSILASVRQICYGFIAGWHGCRSGFGSFLFFIFNLLLVCHYEYSIQIQIWDSQYQISKDTYSIHFSFDDEPYPADIVCCRYPKFIEEIEADILGLDKQS
jgi:hypothetical protein